MLQYFESRHTDCAIGKGLISILSFNTFLNGKNDAKLAFSAVCNGCECLANVTECCQFQITRNIFYLIRKYIFHYWHHHV